MFAWGLNQGVHTRITYYPDAQAHTFANRLNPPLHPKFAKECASCPRKTSQKAGGLTSGSN